MASTLVLDDAETSRYRIHHDQVELCTQRRVEFVDITDLVIRHVRESGITDGTVNIQALHTTAALRINENEPLLLEDLERLFERLVPRSQRWLHDDLEMREGPLPPDERPNGDAHARAMLLGTSETLNIVGGRVQLGRWQHIFLVELDGCRRRNISLTVAGLASATEDS